MLQPVDYLFLVNCSYLPFLVLLYLVEIWAILKPHSPFRSTFYLLFVAAAIADLISVGVSFHELRLPFFPLVNGFYADYDCHTCAQIRVAMTFVCPCVQDLLNCFIALNRFTSIRRPLQNDSIWKKLLPISIGFSWLFALAIFGPSFARKIIMAKMDMGNYTIYFTTEDFTFMPWHNSHKIMSAEIVISSVIIVILYATSGRSLRKLSSGMAKREKERNLLKFGMLNFAIMLPCMLAQLAFEFFPPEWMLVVMYQFWWIIDVKSFCPAITMLLVNKSFRKHIMKSFKLTRSNAVDSSAYNDGHLPRSTIIIKH